VAHITNMRETDRYNNKHDSGGHKNTTLIWH